jgi:ATP-dependent Clp protease ATP-binding subunit ClpC
MRERTRAVVPDGAAEPGEIAMTPRVQHVIGIAGGLAIGLRHARVTPEHLLLGLLEDGEGIPVRLLEEVGARRAELAEAVRDELKMARED